jgi:hypothetical protein
MVSFLIEVVELAKALMKIKDFSMNKTFTIRSRFSLVYNNTYLKKAKNDYNIRQFI